MAFSDNHIVTDAVNIAVLTLLLSQQMYNEHMKKKLALYYSNS